MSELSFSTVGFIIWGCACAVGLVILIVWPRCSGRRCSFLVERTFMVYLGSQLVASILRVMDDIFVGRSSSSWLKWAFWQAMIVAASAYLIIGIVVGTVVQLFVCTACVCIHTPPPPPAVGLGLDLNERNVNAGEMGRNNVNVNMNDDDAGVDTVDAPADGMHSKSVGDEETLTFVPVCGTGMSSLLSPSQTKRMKLALLVGLLLSVGLSVALLTLQIMDRPDLFPILVFCYYLPAALLSFLCVLAVWWSGFPPDVSSSAWVSVSTSCITCRNTGTTRSTYNRPTDMNTMTTTPTNQNAALGIRRLSVVAAIVGMIDFIVPALAYIGLDRYLWEETFVTRVLDSLIYIPLIIPWVMRVSQQAPLDKISLIRIVLFDVQYHTTTSQSETMRVQYAS
eukprot:scaffold67100_cov51-Attheya_sp.AAC.2